MKRIDIVYGGEQYSVGGRELADLQREIATGLASNAPYWLEVNDGAGQERTAFLLITPAAQIALVPVPTPPES